MANTYAAPWVLDTASTTVPVHPFGSKTAPIYIRGLTFIGYTTGAADSAVFKNAAGDVVITLTGTADLSPVALYLGSDQNGYRGLYLTTLTSGKVVAVVD